MLQIEDLKQELQAQQPKIEYLKAALGYDQMMKEKEELDREAADPNFWNDVENTKKVLKEQKLLNEKIGCYDALVNLYEETQTMIELASAVRRVRRQQRDSFLPRRCRRHRGAGLGSDAVPDVCPLERASPL